MPSSDSPRDMDDDESSLTSLSDLEEEAGSAAELVEVAHGESIQSAGPQEIQTESGQPEKADDGGPASTSSSTDMDRRWTSTASTPKLDLLLANKERQLERAIREATNNYALQENSYTVVQSALESLPTGEQQAMLSLMLNRYSAFCTSVDIPLFPLSPAKVALFLSQSITRVSEPVDPRMRRSNPLLRLPTTSPHDSSLSRDEGTRLTRELAQAWVQALAFAQLATREIWSETLPSSSPSGSEGLAGSLTDDPVILEIIAAIPSVSDWQEWEQQGGGAAFSRELPQPPDPQRPRPDHFGRHHQTTTTTTTTTTSTTTRWTKRGKVVAGPTSQSLLGRPSNVAAFDHHHQESGGGGGGDNLDLTIRRLAANDNLSPAPSIDDTLYAFEMPLPTAAPPPQPR